MIGRKSEEKMDFAKTFQNKRIPILTLDERWHQLFPEYDKPTHIKELEKKLNDLIKEQGKETTDIQDLKKLKKKLMDEIMNNMDAVSGKGNPLKIKKLEKSQKYIKEINVKLQEYDDDLNDLPHQIREANEKLMIESMKICYERLKDNKEEIVKCSDWITKAREELKNKILVKQDLEMKSATIYNYMHDLLGAEAIQAFDNEEDLEI